MCRLSSINFTSATLTVLNAPVLLTLCPNGFTVALRATRSTDATLSATCSMIVAGEIYGRYLKDCFVLLLLHCDSLAVSQYIGVPTITNCGATRSITERSATGTFIGSALNAINPNVGTSITWAFISPPVNFPISIGLCDGQLRVITPFLWTASQSYAVTVQVKTL